MQNMLGDTAFKGINKKCQCCKHDYASQSSARRTERQEWLAEWEEDLNELLDSRKIA